MKEDLYQLEKSLGDILPKKRYLHSLGVMTTAFSMALVHDADYEKALIAGLLHDCAKYMTGEEMLTECITNGVPVKQVEMLKPDLLHAKLGAFYAKSVYNIEDEEILSAITWHTTGRPDMTLLEKIIFVADYMEPNRTSSVIPNLDNIRKLSFENLDKAVYQILGDTIAYLMESGKLIDETTADTYDFYKRKLCKE
ncbi:putative HD superfamily hydrolase of NAD metabolism [Anaerocolumna jejuensis DSM 15929]|uniref:bis(5'-nucleosyl)-tetraphosphatase (symmetrical) n=1 Tax=Anaerocolumna jejuensis DSM 15929 TaxID=1121322 RepID=A0A1M6JRV3_9FIRM|nr:bis(5'-nucleosyl)-tetraphosphatase (symmetrical) YqeK [Anaerocolumna jejuensis]SHJ49393.1 putative HD superfamily hydrolase of NAD metabolism [Anaerocolumna jejuensis DSM 15929]